MHALVHTFLNANLTAVESHLWSSTLLLLGALLLARLVRGNARIRYAILLAGIAKFALPSAALLRLLSLCGIDLAALLHLRPEGVPLPFRILGGPAGTAATKTAASEAACIAAGVWALIVTALVMRWLLARRRMMADTLGHGRTREVSERELRAVANAYATFGIAAVPRALRSAAMHAPAALGIFRPMVVLPISGCDHLDDDELHAIVVHEAAHVARRDNLAGSMQAMAGALLWFHPLIWLANRDLAAAREEACDEAVSDLTGRPDTYLLALTKTCHSAIASAVAGVSCMASSRLKERMEHLMRYTPSSHPRLASRITMIAAAAAVLIFTAATGIMQAGPGRRTEPYTMKVNIEKNSFGHTFDAIVTRTATGEAVSAPRISLQQGIHDAQVTSDVGGETFKIECRVEDDGSGSARLTVTKDGAVLQTTYQMIAPKTAAGDAKPSQFSGEPISVDLKDAEIHNLMKTFATLSGHTIELAPDVEARVTIKVYERPWDEVLHQVLSEHGLVARVEGNTIFISKGK
jgi:beta-lactamase regulating signal transducer with metallopeptidase domain